jgi:hypothetical protein
MKRLSTHLAGLKKQGVIETWYDRRIVASDDWSEEIDERLADAQIVLCLVSPDFLASEYCYEREMHTALEGHDRGTKRVVPVIIRPTDWERSPLGRLQAVPRDARPVTTWPNRDQAWIDVAKSLRQLAESLPASKAGRRSATKATARASKRP